MQAECAHFGLPEPDVSLVSQPYYMKLHFNNFDWFYYYVQITSVRIDLEQTESVWLFLEEVCVSLQLDMQLHFFFRSVFERNEQTCQGGLDLVPLQNLSIYWLSGCLGAKAQGPTY